MRRSRRLTVAAGVLAVEVIGAAVLGAVIWRTDHGTEPRATWDVGGRAAPSAAASQVRAATPSAPPPSPGVVAASPPLRLTVPAAGIDASVVPYTAADAARGVDGTTGEPCLASGVITCVDPASAHDVAWQVGGVAGVAFGAQPGTDATGTVYLYGHATTGGSAVFNDVGSLEPGDEATVTTANGTLVYRVQRTVDTSKTAFASSAEATDQVPGRLLLVSCDHGAGATLVNGGYSTSNVVVVLQLERP